MAGFLSFGAVSLVKADGEPIREIRHVTGDLYRFRNNKHYSVFLVPGHDEVGTYNDVRLFRHYMEDLETAVSQGIKAGMTADAVRDSVSLTQYSDWTYFEEWGPLNVAGMYRLLTERKE